MNCPNCGEELLACSVSLPGEPNDRFRCAWVCSCAPKQSLPTHIAKGFQRMPERPFQSTGKTNGVVIGGPDDVVNDKDAFVQGASVNGGTFG